MTVISSMLAEKKSARYNYYINISNNLLLLFFMNSCEINFACKINFLILNNKYNLLDIMSAWTKLCITRVILPGENSLMVDQFDTKILSLTQNNISHKLENFGATSSCSLLVRVLCCKSLVLWFNSWTRLLCYFLQMFLMFYDKYGKVYSGRKLLANLSHYIKIKSTCIVWYTKQVDVQLYSVHHTQPKYS